ncbi:hypothetical protein EDB81DRAFT_801064 [Dactylonectria macrodidyma]|uniref:Uncharacterized protein n=1 Tax=Dactylonectria macrodidyma TaxID=307937 RepID=A0A9P9EI12_9HYPO|nr:hypothetical protein EDB81DRAFT_801064 [Dactylonectria macrodidyma]
MLQSFSQGRYAKYWIVEVAKIPGRRTDAMMDGTPGDQCSDIGGRRNGDRDGDEANEGGGGADDGWDGMLVQYGRALKVEEDQRRRIAQRPGGVDHDDRWVDKAGWAKHFQELDLKRIYQLGLGPESKAVRKGMRDGPERGEQETLARLAESFGREMSRCV